MKNNNSVLRMVLTLVVIAVVSAGAMSYVNKITAPLIAQQDELKLQNSLKEVIEAESFELVGEGVYKAVKGEETAGICVINLSAGYGGDIKVMTGVDNNGKVTGVSILSHGETAGLGANATKEEFRAQYKGKTSEISVSKTKSTETEIKALSGATITSNAVTKAVNEALEIASEYIEGGDK